jgi:hypothetical protein
VVSSNQSCPLVGYPQSKKIQKEGHVAPVSSKFALLCRVWAGQGRKFRRFLESGNLRIRRVEPRYQPKALQSQILPSSVFVMEFEKRDVKFPLRLGRHATGTFGPQCNPGISCTNSSWWGGLARRRAASLLQGKVPRKHTEDRTTAESERQLGKKAR